MPSFICKVMTPQGQIVKVKLNESDKLTCLKKLKSNGMTPISVENSIDLFQNKSKKKNSATIYSKRKKHKLIDFNSQIQFSNKITIEELKKFTQDFYLLKKSKFTNKHALLTIINNAENPHFRSILHEILDNIEKGEFMYKAMEKYDLIFPIVYINLIKTGEVTGDLEISLRHAIKYLEDEEEINDKLKKILLPNIVMFLSIIILLFIAMLIGVPVLQKIFLSNGNIVELPKITIILSSIANAILKYWYLLLIAIICVSASFIKYINTEKGKYKFDYFKYNNFLFGKITYLLDFSRLIRCIYINLKNNLRVQDTLEISKNVVRNTYMLDTIEKSISNIYIGKSWIEPFENEKMLNPIIIEILKKGSKNKLSDAVEKVIEYLDFEIENQINKLLKKLPEISYLIVGIVLLLFTIVILLPCIHIYLGGFLFI